MFLYCMGLRSQSRVVVFSKTYSVTTARTIVDAGIASVILGIAVGTDFLMVHVQRHAYHYILRCSQLWE